MADDNETPTIESQTGTNTKPEAATKRPLSLLASEMFGDEFHGEVKKEPDPAEIKPIDAEVETETEPAAESSATTGEPVEDIADIIRQNLEADPTLLAKLKLSTKVDGQSGEVTLEDLVRSYQIQTAAEKRLDDAKAKSADILAETNAKAAKIGERFAEAAALIESLESDLADDIKSVNMDKLRKEDPAEWSAKNTEFEKRRAKIQQRKLDAVTKYNKANQQAQDEAKAAFAKYFAEESSALFEKRPDWRNPETFTNAKSKLTKFLSSVRPNTAQQVSHNHELLLLAEKAMLYDELQANTNAAKKRMVTVPKVLKPGASKPQDQISKERVDKVRDRLRKSGSIDDAFALLKAKRGGK